jgi:hypothetical protein
MVDTFEAMPRVVGLLIAVAALVTLAACATPIPPSPVSPLPATSPVQAAPSESPAPDACAALTAVDVRAAVAALPGWWYDFWPTSEAPDGTTQPRGHTRAEYIAPDRLRDVAWDAIGVRHGTIIIGDRMWTYAGRAEPPALDAAWVAALASPLPGIVDADEIAIWLERVFPFKGSYREATFPFRGDLPGEGLRESPRVTDNECLATDPNTGTSLVTTRSGQLVRMTSENRYGKFIERMTLIFHATMPPAIEPPSGTDLLSKPFIPSAAKLRPSDPR